MYKDNGIHCTKKSMLSMVVCSISVYHSEVLLMYRYYSLLVLSLFTPSFVVLQAIRNYREVLGLSLFRPSFIALQAIRNYREGNSKVYHSELFI